MKEDAAKLVSSAILGLDGKTITVNGKEYTILPPTIKKIVGAGYYLSDFGEEKDTKEMIHKFAMYGKLSKALSWFIQGDDNLSEELQEGTLEEILFGIEEAFKLIGIANFARLLTLVRSVKMAIAKQR